MKTPRRRSLAPVLFAILFSASTSHAQQLITTSAGSTWVFPAGTRDPANTAAPLGPVLGVAVATAAAGPFLIGDSVISDFGNRMVFRVRGTALTVLAGNGVAGFSGDTGAAASASLALPMGLAIDNNPGPNQGTLYIADALNHRIRKVDPSGVIMTVAGNGTAGYAGDNAVGGAITSVQLDFPTGVAVNSSGDVFIADRDNHRIRKLTVLTATVTTVAGSGSDIVGAFADGLNPGDATSLARLNQPSGVAVDGSNNVYIADTANHRIRKLTVGTATVTTVAGDGTPEFDGDGVVGGATSTASLNQPNGVAVDPANSNLVYIADTRNQRIRRLTVSTATIAPVAGSSIYGFGGDTGSALSAFLASPNGVALNAAGTTVFIADTDNARLRTVISGTIDTLAGNGVFKFAGDSGPALSASLNAPNSAAVDSSGNLYIADTGNHRIRKVTPTTGTISTFAGTGTAGFVLAQDGGPAASAQLSSPKAVAVNTLVSPNLLYIADAGNNRIRRVDLLTNIITTLAGNGLSDPLVDGVAPTLSALSNPSGVAVERSTGNVYIADTDHHRIRSVIGNLIDTVAGNGTPALAGDGVVGGAKTSGSLNSPVAVAVDAGVVNLYIADRNNHRIRKVNGGTITTVAGSTVGYSGDGGSATDVAAKLNFPSGVAVDGSGNFYIGDRDNFRIRKVSGGNISTVAGTGSAGFSGDGALSTAATLAGPTGLWLDAFGNLFLADSPNDRIRKLFSGQVIAGSVQGAPSAQVSVPITLALFGGATLNSVTFGVTVTPALVGGGPALLAPLSFVKDAAFSLTTPDTSLTGNDSISVSMLNQSVAPFPLGGTVKLGDVVVTIPTVGQGAADGETYTVKITVADGSLAGAPVPLSPGSDSTLTVVIGSYLVGDSSPQLVNLNPGFDSDKNDPLEFGDGVLTILDLIDALRAITIGGAFRPGSCSARFDAMDSSDATVTGNPGSDGALLNPDLLVTLRRVTGIDATRPRRTATTTMLACALPNGS